MKRNEKWKGKVENKKFVNKNSLARSNPVLMQRE